MKSSFPKANLKCVYSQEDLNEIFQRFSIKWPNPKGELYYTNSFTLVIAVMLSAQATDISVNKITPVLFSAADTPQKMLQLGEDKIRNYIKTIGLYHTKTKNIINLSKKIIEDFNSEVPKTREKLMSLPGVGRKTANVVLSTAFGIKTIAVDTHVFRISNRINLAKGKTPEKVEEKLMHIVPEKYIYHAHNWLVLHGRYICKARKPNCKSCIIADICKSPENVSTLLT
ncbi:Endonuclease III [Liberibacter crescens BT-1]|uniref:Endonuclease III n=1 Tax=Liberibacter crescens (strain BT-1) TaxID=1215343 RepID=L0EUL9_LIBCB|nr:Endonuclease III [Liberibacter crescens BT-1]AMC12560.1 DNA lyase [Liberibacter crescens]